MGRGATRVTGVGAGPQKGKPMSQADRRAYKQAREQWYKSTDDAMVAQIKKPGISSKMTRAEIREINRSQVEKLREAYGGRQNVPRGQAPSTVLHPRGDHRWGDPNRLKAARSVKRAQLHEQRANLASSNRRGLTPGQAQSRLSRLKAKQAEGYTSVKVGRGQYASDHRIKGGVQDSKFKPTSVRSTRTTGSQLRSKEKIGAQRRAEATARRSDYSSVTEGRQKALKDRMAVRNNKTMQRAEAARTARQRRADSAPNSPEAVKTTARQMDSSRHDRHVARTYRGENVGRPIGASKGLSKSSQSTRRQLSPAKPGRPRGDGRPSPSKMTKADRQAISEYNKAVATGRRAPTKSESRDFIAIARTNARLRQKALAATRKSPMTRAERKHFGNRRPSAERLMEYRAAQARAAREAREFRGSAEGRALQRAESAKRRGQRRRRDNQFTKRLREEGFTDNTPLPDSRAAKRKRRPLKRD